MRELVHAIFVIPDAQVHQLDLQYQFYVFHLFHRSALNRALHVLGLPLVLAGTYAVLSSWPLLAEATAGCVLAMHVVLAVRHRMLAILPLVIAVNAALWLAARDVLLPLAAGGSVWLALAVPVAGATIAYLGHYAEPWVPPPVSECRHFLPQAVWWRRVRWGRLAFFLAWAPAHVVVEAISAPRNLFVLLLGGAAAAGLLRPAVDALRRRATALIAHPEPPLTQAGFRAAPPASGAVT